MKSHTDLEQSKKLAEILPVESADLWWDTNEFEPRLHKHYHQYLGITINPIPCWSLAALIEALPLGVDIHNISDGHKIYYYVELYTKEIYMKSMGKEILLSTERRENLVDCCYEMILKLKERNLL